MTTDRTHEPECGEHFCDRCGDCLHCHGGEECIEGGPHLYPDPDNQNVAIDWKKAFEKGVAE